jgi:glycine cleavage system H protein
MSDFPSDLRYTKEHEWARLDGNVARVGITSFAVEQLGDVTLVELPAVGDEVEAEQVFGTVESVKAVSDLFAPVTGKVVKINEALADQPELVNDDCMGEAWMVEIEMSDPGQADGLLSADDYAKIVEEAS